VNGEKYPNCAAHINLCKKETREGHVNEVLFKSETGNRFSLTCKGGCIHIVKVVHDCYSKMARQSFPNELKIVQKKCEAKEHCTFEPGVKMFGKRKCYGKKRTLIKWQCMNHQEEITNHKRDTAEANKSNYVHRLQDHHQDGEDGAGKGHDPERGPARRAGCHFGSW